MAKRTWSNQFTINEDRPLTVPSWLLTTPWTDVSWGNEVCPRFVNSELEVALWVDYDNPEDRELDTGWKKFSLVRVLNMDEDILEDNEFFSTESEDELVKYLISYAAALHCDKVREGLQALLSLPLNEEATDVVRCMLDDLASVTELV